jgi:hypothetical protein
MGDRFAAAAMMAGHPNETSPEGLRNLPFALYMGELDAAYDRNQKAKDWKIMLDSLQQKDPSGYIHKVELVEGKGHWMDRADTAAIEWMSLYKRDNFPQKVVWKQDDVLHPNFYWLEVPLSLAENGKKVIAECKNNVITILENYSDTLVINLNDYLIYPDEKIAVDYKGKRLFEGKVERNILNIFNSLKRRFDMGIVYSVRLMVVNNETVIPFPSNK